MKKILLLCMLLFVMTALWAQTCTAPFNTHTLTFTTPYTLANGNMGVAIVYRNSNHTMTPLRLQGLIFEVNSTGCGDCNLIQDAFATSLNGLNPTTDVIDNGEGAFFAWNGVPTGGQFPLVDGEVIMVLDLGRHNCLGALCFDLEFSFVFMFANGSPVPSNQIVRCGTEICKTNGASGCDVGYGAPVVLGPNPFAQPTVTNSDLYANHLGYPTSAVQFFFLEPELCISKINFTILVTGDLTLTGYSMGISPWPGATVTQNGNEITGTWADANGTMSASPEFLLLLHFAKNPGCGHVNFCNVEIIDCEGNAIPLTLCPRKICIKDERGGGDGKDPMRVAAGEAGANQWLTDGVAYPNPFSDLTTVPFEVLQAGTVNLHVYTAQGQLVESRSGQYAMGKHELKFGQGLSTGIYFYTLECGGQVLRGKVVRE